MSSSLKNIKISDSYPRLVQQVDGIFYDGAGNRIPGIGGPQGPQGIVSLGTQGPQGFQGVPGDTGSGIQGTQGFQGPDGTNGTNALWNFANMWSSGVVYVIGDVVTYAGQTWYCINQTTAGQGPFDGNIDTYWQLLAAKGLNGTTGSAGNGSSSIWIADESPEIPGHVFVNAPDLGNNTAGIQINTIDVYGNDQSNMFIALSGLANANISTVFTVTNGEAAVSLNTISCSGPYAVGESTVSFWLINGNIINYDILTGPAPYTVVYSVSGLITSPLNFTQGSRIESVPNSSGDGLNATTMILKPDSSLGSNNNQYIVLDPTSPNHIHIRAGGNIDNSLTDIFIGGEENNLRVSDDQHYSELNSYKMTNVDSQSFPVGIPFTSASWFTDIGYYIVINNPFNNLYDVLSAFTYPSTLSILYDNGGGSQFIDVNVYEVDVTDPISVKLSVTEIPPVEPTVVTQFNFVINDALRSKVTAIANTGVNIWTGNYNNPAVWTFGATGGLIFPGGSVQTVAYPGVPAFISSGNSAPGSAVVANETNVNINFSDGGSGAWSFGATSMSFPDDTVQTTAYIPKYKVFTALLTQNGPYNPGVLNTGDNLILGYTYTITENGLPQSEFDFTNVGAPNNDLGTSFIATGTTPTSWGFGVRLDYNEGAPRAIILENTIGNIWFIYKEEGKYQCWSSTLFSTDKTIVSMDAYGQDGNPACNITYKNLTTDMFRIEAWKDRFLDDALVNSRLEIKVYY